MMAREVALGFPSDSPACNSVFFVIPIVFSSNPSGLSKIAEILPKV